MGRFQGIITWTISVQFHYIRFLWHISILHFGTFHVLLQYSGITFCHFSHAFDRVPLLLVLLSWRRNLRRFGRFSVTCSCVSDNLRGSMETVLGLTSSSIVTVCG